MNAGIYRPKPVYTTEAGRTFVSVEVNGHDAPISVRVPEGDELSVFIGSPVYKDAHPEFLKSVGASMKYLVERGNFALFEQVNGDAMVERARASVLSAYLAFPAGTFTHCVMFDSDISWHPSALEAMCRSGKDAIGGAYAFKSPPGEPKHGQPVVRYYPIDQTEALRDPAAKHLIPMRYLGGGSTILRDEFLWRAVRAYPELIYYTNPDHKKRTWRTWDGWQSILIVQPDWGLDEDGEPMKELLSEDYALCERLVTIHERDGGPQVHCWLDPYVHHSHHVGEVAYDVEWFDEIKKKRAASTIQVKGVE